MNSLEDLVQHRGPLLLAEAVAWLHDMGKCDEQLLRQSASDFQSAGIQPYDYKTAHLHLINANLSLTLLGESVSVRDLIEKSRPKLVNKLSEPWLMRILGLCHQV